MPALPKGQRQPVELRERAVRMVFEHTDEYPSQWKAIESIAHELDLNRETLRVWVRRAEVDQGTRPGLSSDERARMKDLERENKGLDWLGVVCAHRCQRLWATRNPLRQAGSVPS